MVESVADCRAIALAEQEVVDRLLDLQDVDIHPQVGITPSRLLHRARHHHLRNARHRSDAQL